MKEKPNTNLLGKGVQTLRSNEALSSGHIFNQKEKDRQREILRQQTEEFYRRKQ